VNLGAGAPIFNREGRPRLWFDAGRSYSWAFMQKGGSPMLRIILLNMFMFLLPFLIYGAYVFVTTGGQMEGLWQGAPVFWLLAIGCVLLLVTVGAVISFSGGEPGGTYRPPQIEDGAVRPGTIE
jgi:hypothetical protein